MKEPFGRTASEKPAAEFYQSAPTERVRQSP